jgi:hypothetical protein
LVLSPVILQERPMMDLRVVALREKRAQQQLAEVHAPHLVECKIPMELLLLSVHTCFNANIFNTTTDWAHPLLIPWIILILPATMLPMLPINLIFQIWPEVLQYLSQAQLCRVLYRVYPFLVLQTWLILIAPPYCENPSKVLTQLPRPSSRIIVTRM